MILCGKWNSDPLKMSLKMVSQVAKQLKIHCRGDVRYAVQSLGMEDPLEEEMATHSWILAWKIAWTRRAWQATVHRVAKSCE